MISPLARYTGAATSVALGSAVLLAALGAMRGQAVLGWAVTGWLVMAVPAIAGGAWVARVHGRPDSGFLAGRVATMLLRLGAAAVGGFAAASRGRDAVGLYLVGVGATYVPLQLFEVLWFVRRTRGADAGR